MNNLFKHNVIGLVTMLLVLASCGNSKADTEEAKQKKPEMGEMHKESEAKEAMLTEAQCRNLNMRIDTVAQRVMKQYVEANGQLEVPPQNKKGTNGRLFVPPQYHPETDRLPERLQ